MKKSFSFLGNFIKRLILYVSMIFPRSSKVYIFGAWFGEKYADNSKVLFEYYLNHSNKKCVWITSSENVYDNLRKADLPVYINNSFKGIYYQLHAGKAISSTGIVDFNKFLLGNAVHINLWHGVGGGKKIGLDDRCYCDYALSKTGKFFNKMEKYPLRKNYFVCTSDEMKKVFMSAFQIPEDHFIYAGQPRNDMFFDKNYHYKTIDKSEFLGKKIITYLPTHRKTGEVKIECSKIFDLKKLDQFCEENGLIFIIKKHFYHSCENESDVLKDCHNIIDLTGKKIDTNELLMVSDYLISDYSSVATDYLLLNKPVFYYCYDFENYTTMDRDMYWSYDQITPGNKSRSFEELLNDLEETVVLKKDRFVEERNRVLEMFYSKDSQGTASEKIMHEIDSIIK